MYDSVYEIMIHKGGLLGVLCVAVLIFTNLFLKKYRKNHHSDGVVVHLIKSIRLIFVLIFLGCFLIQSGLLEKLFERSDVTEIENIDLSNLPTDTVNKVLEERAFVINDRYRFFLLKIKN